jgi:hypothetical protein
MLEKVPQLIVGWDFHGHASSQKPEVKVARDVHKHVHKILLHR